MIILLIGPGGAGKTTTANILAEKYNHSVVIEVDHLRHMIRVDRSDPFSREGREQLVLSTQNACLLAKSFAQKDFVVIVDDCVTGKERLDMYHEHLKDYELKTILLLPRRESVQARDSHRVGSACLGEKNMILYDKFLARIKEENRWEVIDNSDMDAEMTANKVYNVS